MCNTIHAHTLITLASSAGLPAARGGAWGASPTKTTYTYTAYNGYNVIMS